ncbi:histone demethylase Jhd2p [[Candida] anglica]|uniref:Histone demethylase Jhd2p n=1 Tax=[Candida] anglica TaxID=148631 RepID=A0ABP0EF38_9ASCO
MTYDKSLLIPSPVLSPSNAEFEDPMAYLSRPDIAKLGSQYGILKVIPPPGWQPPFSLSPTFKFHTRLQRLSDLGLTTRSRAFFRKNMNRFLKMRNKRSLRLYFRAGKDPLDSSGRKKTKVYYYDLYVAVDKFGGSDNMSENDWMQLNAKFGVTPSNCHDLEEEYNTHIKAYATFLASNNMKSDSLDVDGTNEDEDNCILCAQNDRPSETLLCDHCDNAFHMDCLEPPLKAIPTGIWYCDKCLIGTGEYGFEEQVDLKYTLPEFYKLCQEFDEDFKANYNNGEPLSVDSIEKKFWEFVDEQKSDLEVKYGADIHNLVPGEISGFPMTNTPGVSLGTGAESAEYYTKHPFNLTRLPFAKGSLMKYINTSISGMTIPWIYIGSLLSTFCWHVEDHYTLSINYCHFGATKKWYGIPSYQADQFESLMKDSAPDLFQRQPDLLHQLVTLLSPMTLVKNNIKCVYADQQPNEFIITYPRVYHSGFNCGFNFNEAVNFTLEPWLEYGEKAVEDYRLIKKENVFNHYQLVENILRSFLEQDANHTDSKFSQDFIQRCLLSFDKFYSTQIDTIAKLDHEKFTTEFKPPKVRKGRVLEDEQMGFFADDEDEDEKLCDGCKTHIGYHYFFLPNKEHQYSQKKKAKEANEYAIKRRKIIPENIGLLTPHDSPQDKIKEEQETEKIVDTVSSRRMSLLTGGGDITKEHLKLSEEEEFRQLISSAKKTNSEEPESSSKRRRSTRIQKQEKSEIAAIGRSKRYVPFSNEKKQLNLCLECVKIYDEDLPMGSVLVYESYPEKIVELVNSVKEKLSTKN